jgi:hypothetical protein
VGFFFCTFIATTMTFTIHYNDLDEPSVKNKSLVLLELLLNYHLSLKFHGWTYDDLIIHILNNPPAHQKYKSKVTMEHYASVEIAGDFYNNYSLNMRDFLAGFALVEKVVKIADDIPVKGIKDFRAGKLLEDLKSLREMMPETEDGLSDLYKKRTGMESLLQIRRVDGYLLACKENPREKTKGLIGIRLFGKTSDSHEYFLSEVVGNLLRREQVFTPGYSEIYITISDTVDEAKTTSPFAIHTWHKYTYAALDSNAYKTAGEEEKEKMMLRSIAEGLRLIADIDHLDRDKIERAINRAEQGGARQELLYTSKENKTLRADVIYQMVMVKDRVVPFYLEVTGKVSGRSKRVLIDTLSPIFAPYSIGKITLTKTEIVIKGRPGTSAEMTRNISQLPSQYIFNIADMLK